MISRDAKFSRRRLRMGLIATLAALCLLFFTTIGALADTVNISDKANVLDKGQVQSEAAKLSYPVNIYTLNNFTGTESAFNQEAIRTLNDAHNPRLIVIAIDTQHKYLAIVGGKNVSTSNSVYNDAVSAFKSNYNSGGYTGATIAALQSLQSSLGAASGSGNGSSQTNNAAGFSFVPICLVGLLIVGLIVIAGVFFMRRARTRIPPYPMGNQYQQPYNQGGYPPNYSGPGYNQGPGMNPWAAGGLGAAAGGLIGYELGKHEGQEQGSQQGNVGGGDFGGGAGGTFGGDSGGGGDFGGGAGGDFGGGGGGDFGGGGGGDFGGGGGGSF